MEYLLHMQPVINTANYWLAETFWAGFLKSPIFEKVIAHLKVGAQKNTMQKFHLIKQILYLLVNNPAGWVTKFLMTYGKNGVFINVFYRIGMTPMIGKC